MFRKRVAALMATAGLVLASSGLVLGASAASAAQGTGGNNGSVKLVDGAGNDIPDNDPHLPCNFGIEWYDFDAGTTAVADVTFTMQSPTGPDDHQIVGTGGATHLTFDGHPGIDHTEDYRLLITGTPLQQQGFHLTVTIDTTASTGTAINKSKTFWMDACAASPAQPTVVQSPACGVEGYFTVPATEGVDYYRGDTKLTPGTHYSGPVTTTITAEAQDGYVLSDPQWSADVDIPAAAQCDTRTAVTPVAPTVVPSDSCGVQGYFTVPDTTGVDYYLGDTVLTPGTHYDGPVQGTVTAKAQDGYELTDATWSSDVTVAAASTCPPGETTGVLGTPHYLQIEGCGQVGSVVEMVDADHVAYTIDGGENWSVQQGTHTITATLVDGATSFSGPTDGWTVADGGKSATRTVDLGTFSACPEPNTVTPAAPTFLDPTCDAPDRVEAVYADTETVHYALEGTVARNATVTVTATPAGDAVFPEGVVTSWTHTFDGAIVCGTETIKPRPTKHVTHASHPSRRPTVLGTEAVATAVAVPTAVDAGLATWSGDPRSSSHNGLLAQAMVAAGLVLLLAGGWLGMGRRRRGAHQH
ncbi:MAG: hypothetical protein ACXVW6_13070 [Nocardioidaceae bacterium]